MFKVGIMIISSLIITSKSGIIVHDSPAVPNSTYSSGASAVSSHILQTELTHTVQVNSYPPNLLLLNNNNIDITTSEDNDNSSKNKKKINDDELKLKLSSMIDKDSKIKNKSYKDNFISYILSYNDKKEEYNDDINNDNNEKIKNKYALYIESDQYIKSLNLKMDILVYEHTMFSDWSIEEKKIIINE